MEKSEVLKLAKILWEYHLLHQKLQKADCILVLGSHDVRVAQRAAELFLDGYAPLIVFSGGIGKGTKEWTKTEARRFAEIAKEMGVPDDAMLLEEASTNTGENILFSKKLLEEQGLSPQSFIVVQKPYMERRTFATFKKLWPEKECIVTSPKISFEDYPSVEVQEDRFMNLMVGDLQRMKLYAEKGFQIPQEIPEDVWNAYEQLVAAGYDEFVIKQ